MTDCPQDHQPPPGTGAPFATFPFPFTLSFPFSHTWQEQDNSSPFYPLSYTSIHLLYDLSFTLPKTCQLLLFVFAKTKWNLTSCHVHHKSIPEHLASYFSTLWWLLHRKPWPRPAPCTRSGKRPKISSLMVITDMDKGNFRTSWMHTASGKVLVVCSMTVNSSLIIFLGFKNYGQHVRFWDSD